MERKVRQQLRKKETDLKKIKDFFFSFEGSEDFALLDDMENYLVENKGYGADEFEGDDARLIFTYIKEAPKDVQQKLYNKYN